MRFGCFIAALMALTSSAEERPGASPRAALRSALEFQARWPTAAPPVLPTPETPRPPIAPIEKRRRPEDEAQRRAHRRGEETAREAREDWAHRAARDVAGNTIRRADAESHFSPDQVRAAKAKGRGPNKELPNKPDVPPGRDKVH